MELEQSARRLNKGFSPKSYEGSQVRHETPEGWISQNVANKNKSPNPLNDGGSILEI